MENEKNKVKEWYLKEYNTDELGKKINEEITFYDIFYALDRYKDIYEILGVEDSIVRERVFQKLADIMKVEYNYIYEQWLLCN